MSKISIRKIEIDFENREVMGTILNSTCFILVQNKGAVSR